VLLSAAAYVLVETLRRVGLAGAELANAQVGTIRLKLLKIGGRIVRSVRRIVIHLAGGFPIQRTFATILRRLQDWSCIPAPSSCPQNNSILFVGVRGRFALDVTSEPSTR
jgi:hypothetical protein